MKRRAEVKTACELLMVSTTAEAEATGGVAKPFFEYIGPHAPHYPAMPAPWYEKEFPDVTIPITPNYNLSSPDKAQHVRQNPGFTQLVRKNPPFCDSFT